MSARRILITPRSVTQHGHPALERLRAAGFETILGPKGRQPSEAELCALLPGCHGYLAGVEPITAHALSVATELEAISRNGVGVDNVDLAAARVSIDEAMALVEGFAPAGRRILRATILAEAGDEDAAAALADVLAGTIPNRAMEPDVLDLAALVLARRDPSLAAEALAAADDLRRTMGVALTGGTQPLRHRAEAMVSAAGGASAEQPRLPAEVLGAVTAALA